MFWNLEGNGERAGGKMEEGDRIAGRSVQEWKVENCLAHPTQNERKGALRGWLLVVGCRRGTKVSTRVKAREI